VIVFALVCAALLSAAPDARASLTEGPRLAAVYDTILEARFDQVEATLERTCPPAPDGACKALNTVSVWWQILLDPDSKRLDARLNELAAAAIAANDAWTRREPKRGEAWFYLAGSYAPLVQWRVLRGERLAAAREGSRIKSALEQALALDPSLADAYFGIGIYHYYADVAPTTAKILRWFLFLPGGDRAEGLEEMLKARDKGELLTGEADYQLHLIYLWYERKTEAALALLRGLDTRYPTNPLFLQRIAEVEDEYYHDHKSSAAAWSTLIDRVRAGRANSAGTAEIRARLGLATELAAMSQTAQAIDELKIVVSRDPSSPYGARAQAQLQLGLAYDRLGQRDLAVAAYNAAMTLTPADDTHHIRDRARAGLRTRRE